MNAQQREGLKENLRDALNLVIEIESGARTTLSTGDVVAKAREAREKLMEAMVAV